MIARGNKHWKMECRVLDVLDVPAVLDGYRDTGLLFTSAVCFTHKLSVLMFQRSSSLVDAHASACFANLALIL
jgi:hypothetical protein